MGEKIGEFLYRVGVMEAWQVEKVLQAQHAGDDRFFGEIALGLGYIKDEAVERYLNYLVKQRAECPHCRWSPKPI